MRSVVAVLSMSMLAVIVGQQSWAEQAGKFVGTIAGKPFDVEIFCFSRQRVDAGGIW